MFAQPMEHVKSAGVILGVFDNVFDWTAIGTLALAVATFVSLYFARRSINQTQQQIKLGQQQLEQTQREIELSRAEVEQAHRPVIVPFQKSGLSITFRGGEVFVGRGPAASENPPSRPELPRYSQALLPVENVGMGPALNIRGKLQAPRGVGTVPFPTEALAVGAHGIVVFENWTGESLVYSGNDSTVSALLEYDDVAGRTHFTNVIFDVGHNAYTSTFSGT